MPTAATGPLSLALEALGTLLSNCASFQTWTGTGSAAAALAHFHRVAPPPPDSGGSYTAAEVEALYPMAVADVSREGGGYAAQRIGVNSWKETGSLVLHLEAAIAAADHSDPAEAEVKFANAVGGIVLDLATLAGTGTYLVLKSIAIREGPARCDEDQESAGHDYQFVDLALEWGL